jgi:hypothetical protein
MNVLFECGYECMHQKGQNIYKKSGNSPSQVLIPVLFVEFKVMVPWAGGAGIGHLHPEHAVQTELHDL